MIYVVYSVFISQFLNTMMVLLVDANLTQQKVLLGFGRFFDGADADFNSRWFVSIGDTIIGAMIVNIFSPFVEEFVRFGFLFSKRLFDQGICCCRKKTRTKTLYGYLRLYAGPRFSIHYKYSMILNVLFISMMFGTGLPILFPISLAFFWLLYITEKFLLYYGYR